MSIVFRKKSNVFENISHVFGKRFDVFEEKGPRSIFPRILFMAPNVSKAPSKSLDSLKSSKFSPIVQTLCAKDGNQYIFTSSSLEGDLAPYKGSFWRKFRVRFITL